MKEAFEKHRFNAASLDLLNRCEQVIHSYADQGLILTVRQLYYRLVAADAIPNTEKSYKKIIRLLNNARLSGVLSWTAIEDRTRGLASWAHDDSPEDAMETCIYGYSEDKWLEQPVRIEAWVEKEALAGVVGQVCRKLEMPYFACRGYVSQSEMWRAAKRVEERTASGITTHILHLGDHDPSGVDMTRDNTERLEQLSWMGDVKVHRLALNMDQVRKYNPPPNPAKMTDSRVGDYLVKYGSKSWELDALEPAIIQQLIKDAHKELLDHDAWENAVAAQEANRELMRGALKWLKDQSSDEEG